MLNSLSAMVHMKLLIFYLRKLVSMKAKKFTFADVRTVPMGLSATAHTKIYKKGNYWVGKNKSWLLVPKS